MSSYAFSKLGVGKLDNLLHPANPHGYWAKSQFFREAKNQASENLTPRPNPAKQPGYWADTQFFQKS